MGKEEGGSSLRYDQQERPLGEGDQIHKSERGSLWEIRDKGKEPGGEWQRSERLGELGEEGGGERRPEKQGEAKHGL